MQVLVGAVVVALGHARAKTPLTILGRPPLPLTAILREPLMHLALALLPAGAHALRFGVGRREDLFPEG